jgi:phospholipid/cholesterol/gamma-HCH transport system ATP-binding protein
MDLIKVKNLVSKVHFGVDWSLMQNEVHGIIGPSGQGKSYFLKILLDILPYESGQILNKKDLPWNIHNESIGVQFQQGGLINSLTIGQNIFFPLRVKMGMDTKYAISIAKYHMEKASLPIKFFDYYPSECSGGMQKRAALARAMVLDPEILFLDEPTAGLDPVVIENYDKLLQDISREGKSIVMVTHDLARLKNLANRISIIIEGKFYTGSFDFLAKHENIKVREFLESYVRTSASF